MTREEAIDLANEYIARKFRQESFAFDCCIQGTKNPFGESEQWDWCIFYTDVPQMENIECSPMTVYIQDKPRRIWNPIRF